MTPIYLSFRSITRIWALIFVAVPLDILELLPTISVFTDCYTCECHTNLQSFKCSGRKQQRVMNIFLEVISCNLVCPALKQWAFILPHVTSKNGPAKGAMARLMMMTKIDDIENWLTVKFYIISVGLSTQVILVGQDLEWGIHPSRTNSFQHCRWKMRKKMVHNKHHAVFFYNTHCAYRRDENKYEYRMWAYGQVRSHIELHR